MSTLLISFYAQVNINIPPVKSERIHLKILPQKKLYSKNRSPSETDDFYAKNHILKYHPKKNTTYVKPSQVLF